METPVMDEMIRLNEGRAAMYSLLSRFYEKESDQRFLASLKELIESRKYIHDELTEYYAVIGSFILKSMDVVSELAVDYSKIFLGIGKRAECASPYESVYTSHNGVMMQEAFEQVQQIYGENGFMLNKSIPVPADHIYIELKFMAALCEKAVAGEDNYDVQEAFSKKHLLNWVPRFCDDAGRIADTDYYKAVAAITEKYITADYAIFAEE